MEYRVRAWVWRDSRKRWIQEEKDVESSEGVHCLNVKWVAEVLGLRAGDTLQDAYVTYKLDEGFILPRLDE